MRNEATVRPVGPLTLAQARQSPCATCATAPCCTHLPLHTFPVTTLHELDHAIYLLNFERILLGITESGEWSVYYQMPCRHLDPESRACRVHATPGQPQICVTYNPFHCWYKRSLTAPTSESFLPVDRARLDFVLERIEFDDDRNIVSVPDWDTLSAAFAALPVALDPSPRPSPATAQPVPVSIRPGPRAYRDVLDPCTGCDAYCCDTLVFPVPAPATISNLDYFRFLLGFPGVELGIADEGWSTVVRTRCRHLSGGRCAIYGQPERPHLCTYYDALKCTYRHRMGPTPPAGFVRVRLEQFAALTEGFEFDDDGTIAVHPGLAQIAERVGAAAMAR